MFVETQIANKRYDEDDGHDDDIVILMSVIHCWSFQYFLQKLLLNPLSPKSDQRQISPCNITAL